MALEFAASVYEEQVADICLRIDSEGVELKSHSIHCCGLLPEDAANGSGPRSKSTSLDD